MSSGKDALERAESDMKLAERAEYRRVYLNGRLRRCRDSVTRLEDITFAAAGVNQLDGVRLVNLFSQAIDENFYGIRERIERFVPDVLSNLSPRDQLTGAPRQILEQRIFFRRQINFPGRARDAVTG